ncbi:MAG: hypothetical protein ABI720_13480 [Actinomycetes bacterium]
MVSSRSRVVAQWRSRALGVVRYFAWGLLILLAIGVAMKIGDWI